MAAMVLGQQPPDLTVEASIDRVRRLMNKPSDSGSASIDQVRLGASKLGLKYVAMSKGDLEAQLDKKRMVVLVGQPGLTASSKPSAYQAAFVSAGYAYTFDGYHSILVMAPLDSGKYLVADPLSKIGTVKLTVSEMHDYYARWGGQGTAVWVS